MAITPDGKHAYVPCRGDGTVRMYQVGADGTLSGGSSVAVGQPDQVVISPDGAHLYVSSDEGIAQFAIAGDGTLSALAPARADATREFYVLAVSPGGTRLYATTLSDQVFQYAIQADGTLGPIPGAPASVSSGPAGTAGNTGIALLTVPR